MLAESLIACLNHAMSSAKWARVRMLPYAGRKVRVDYLAAQLTFMVAEDGRFLAVGDRSHSEVVLCLPHEAPLLALQGIDKLITSIRVEGNADFATSLSFVFQNLHWDAEEELARLIGDIPAHRLGQWIGNLRTVHRSMFAAFGDNIFEYLTFEQQHCLGGREFDDYRKELEVFNAHLSQFESRLFDRLQVNLG